jgi:hypothetical protein
MVQLVKEECGSGIGLRDFTSKSVNRKKFCQNRKMRKSLIYIENLSTFYGFYFF